MCVCGYVFAGNCGSVWRRLLVCPLCVCVWTCVHTPTEISLKRASFDRGQQEERGEVEGFEGNILLCELNSFLLQV